MRHHAPRAAAIAMAAAIMLGVASCKPSEKSYREAYMTTIDARRAADSEYLDSTAMARMQMPGRPLRLALESGDTLAYRVLRVSPVRDGGATADPGSFCTVTGRFRQLFNAREMRARLASAGYGDAMILRSAEPAFYVVAASTDAPVDALAAQRRLAADSTLALRPPYPWVLNPANKPFNK